MDELLITLIFFIFIFSCHVVLHRFLALWSIQTVHTLCCYVVGFILLCSIGFGGLLSYPASTLVVYTLLSIGISILYMSFFLGAQTPAATILAAFTVRKTQTQKSLISLFQKEHLFDKRIDNLLSFGLVEKQKTRYIATTKGRYIAGIILIYQRIFHRPSGG